MRFALLWCLFFVICLGLGYPTLNRYDPARRDPDTVQYREMVIHGSKSAPPHFAHRVLIPYAAQPFFKLAENRIGSWDAGYFGLLVVNAFFMSGAAAILFLISASIAGVNVGLLGSALYLLNFAVPNLFLIGFVDSGEAFFLMIIIWVMLSDRWWIVPFAVVAGVLAKETFALFAATFCATWILTGSSGSRVRKLLFIGAGVVLGFAVLLFVSKATSGTALAFTGGEVDTTGSKVRIAFFALTNRDLWFVFAYLAPLGIAGMKQLPKPWIWATATTVTLAVVLVVWHGSSPRDAGPELARPLFSIAAPLLTCAMASFLMRPVNWDVPRCSGITDHKTFT